MVQLRNNDVGCLANFFPQAEKGYIIFTSQLSSENKTTEDTKTLSDIINRIRTVVLVFKVELEKSVDKYPSTEIKKDFVLRFPVN